MLSILIPVYNEEEILESSVTAVHEYLVARGIEHEIVVASNGSTDNTEQIGRSLGDKYSWFRFFHMGERGVGRAFCYAAEKARGEILISLDIDLPADLKFIDYSVDLLKYCDMVVGSKTMGDQRRRLSRILGSVLYILFAQILFRLTISDYAPSTKAFRKSAVLPLIQHLDSWTGYVFELCVYFKLHDRRIVQIGVDCKDFRKSKFNLIHEGLFRYWHLFRCWRLVKNRNSWIHTA